MDDQVAEALQDASEGCDAEREGAGTAEEV